MMGPRQVEQGVLFYSFSLDAHVPADHLLRSIDRFVELSELRRELAPFYSTFEAPVWELESRAGRYHQPARPVAADATALILLPLSGGTTDMAGPAAGSGQS